MREDLIRRALDLAIDPGACERDEMRFAEIEAALRDALGQKHAVRHWRMAGRGTLRGRA
jgi:hypothetical protein